MKLFGQYALYPVLMFLLCTTVAIADSPVKQEVPTALQTAPAAKPPQVAANTKMDVKKTAEVKKLPPTIKINPGDLSGKIVPAEKTALSPAFYTAWKRVTDSYNYLTKEIPQYEEQSKLYIAKCQECKNKTYSEQDMTAAGCQPTDTVAACSQKLYRWCSASSEPTGVLAVLGNLEGVTDYGKIAKDEFVKSVLNKK